MDTDTITNGQLVDLLVQLGFARRAMDERYEMFTEPKSKMAFPLPKCPSRTPARSSHIDGLRAQLHWRGLMGEADFDAHFVNLAAAKS